LTPGIMIFRPESGLVYFNVDHVCETILKRVGAEPMPPKLLVLDLSAAPRVDLQSAHALCDLADEITAKGILFHLVEARSSVRDRLRSEGLDGRLGGINRFASLADRLTLAVRAYAANGERRYYDTFERELNVDRNRDLAVEGLRQLGLSPAELQLINTAKRNSDNLVHLEDQAFAAVSSNDVRRAIQ